MPDQSNNPFRFWEELKRRKVIRVIPVYAAAAFVLLELVDIIAEPFGLPNWTLKLVFVLLCIGFVISVILSWIYDVTPEGVRKTKPAKASRKPEKTPTSNSWKIATYISILIIVILVILQIVGGRNRSIEFENMEKSIAILPFENLGVEDKYTSLVEAIPIALIMELQKVEGFIVRPRGSTLKYKESNLVSTDIGKQLKVNFLLNGYLQQQDTNVLARITLTRADQDEIIWTQSYEKDLQNIFQVQYDISKSVAFSLKENFVPGKGYPTHNPDAHLAFLSGMDQYWKDETKEDFDQAIRYFKEAVRLDSNFLMAYAKLANSHCWMYHFYFDRTQNRLLQAQKTIDKILEIDPENPEGIFARGLYFYVTNNYEKALEYYERAEGRVFDRVEYNVCLASTYRRQMKLEKANEYFLKAAEIDPQNAIVFRELAETNLLLGNYEVAEKYFDKMYLTGAQWESTVINNILLYLVWEEGTEKSRKALAEASSLPGNESNPYLTHHQVRIDLIDGKYGDALNALNRERFDTISHQFFYRPINFYFAEIYSLQNNGDQAHRYYDSARIDLEAKIAIDPEDSRYHSSLGLAYAGLGRKKEAIEEGLTAISIMPMERDFYRALFRLEDLAHIYTMVGEYHLALEQIDRLLSMHGLLSVNLLKKDPVWKPLWTLPEFNDLIEKHSD